MIRTWGEKRVEPKLKNHVELVELLGLVDMKKGKIFLHIKVVCIILVSCLLLVTDRVLVTFSHISIFVCKFGGIISLSLSAYIFLVEQMSSWSCMQSYFL